jgi:hypothetical protein
MKAACDVDVGQIQRLPHDVSVNAPAKESAELGLVDVRRGENCLLGIQTRATIVVAVGCDASLSKGPNRKKQSDRHHYHEARRAQKHQGRTVESGAQQDSPLWEFRLRNLRSGWR